MLKRQDMESQKATAGALWPHRTRTYIPFTSATSPCPPASLSSRSLPWQNPRGSRLCFGTPSINSPLSRNENGAALLRRGCEEDLLFLLCSLQRECWAQCWKLLCGMKKERHWTHHAAAALEGARWQWHTAFVDTRTLCDLCQGGQGLGPVTWSKVNAEQTWQASLMTSALAAAAQAQGTERKGKIWQFCTWFEGIGHDGVGRILPLAGIGEPFLCPMYRSSVPWSPKPTQSPNGRTGFLLPGSSPYRLEGKAGWACQVAARSAVQWLQLSQGTVAFRGGRGRAYCGLTWRLTYSPARLCAACTCPCEAETMATRTS